MNFNQPISNCIVYYNSSYCIFKIIKFTKGQLQGVRNLAEIL